MRNKIISLILVLLLFASLPNQAYATPLFANPLAKSAIALIAAGFVFTTPDAATYVSNRFCAFLDNKTGSYQDYLDSYIAWNNKLDATGRYSVYISDYANIASMVDEFATEFISSFDYALDNLSPVYLDYTGDCAVSELGVPLSGYQSDYMNSYYYAPAMVITGDDVCNITLSQWASIYSESMPFYVEVCTLNSLGLAEPFVTVKVGGNNSSLYSYGVTFDGVTYWSSFDAGESISILSFAIDSEWGELNFGVSYDGISYTYSDYPWMSIPNFSYGSALIFRVQSPDFEGTKFTYIRAFAPSIPSVSDIDYNPNSFSGNFSVSVPSTFEDLVDTDILSDVVIETEPPETEPSETEPSETEPSETEPPNINIDIDLDEINSILYSIHNDTSMILRAIHISMFITFGALCAFCFMYFLFKW